MDTVHEVWLGKAIPYAGGENYYVFL
jgi:hypothetical protein